MSTKQNDVLFDHLTDWLADRDVTSRDVRQDAKGYYVNVPTGDNGNPGEDGYAVNYKKVYIPKIFTSLL